MKVLGITIVVIVIMIGQAFATQCQSGQNSNRLKTFMFNNTVDQNL